MSIARFTTQIQPYLRHKYARIHGTKPVVFTVHIRGSPFLVYVSLVRLCMLCYKEKLLSKIENKEGNINYKNHFQAGFSEVFYPRRMGKLGVDFLNYADFKRYAPAGIYKETSDLLAKLPSEDCVTCKYLKDCGGGCPVTWKNYSFAALRNLFPLQRMGCCSENSTNLPLSVLKSRLCRV